jgi:aminoglycoside phosphotransferase (APT) family kinase protein
MPDEGFFLSCENARDYLAGRGLTTDGQQAQVRELGGGVSNIVLLVEWPGEPERRWVVKQSLEKLRVKDDWRSERSRIYREADSIQALRPALGDATLPEVIHVDRENFVFVMSAAPAGSVAWKQSLLEGKVDLGVARQAGTLLAKMIATSRADPQFKSWFEDRTVFDQLRIDPYYRTASRRHPDARGPLVALMAQSGNIQTALVHGDYSPKNMLVRDGRIFLIDFEVVHWGDPAFDAAFLLNHLFLKALFRPVFATSYFDAAREFWKGLAEGLSGEASRGFEALTLRHLGGLMLARIDGKSPVEYIQNEGTKDRVRAAAKQILRDQPQRLEQVVRIVRRKNESS